MSSTSHENVGNLTTAAPSESKEESGTVAIRAPTSEVQTDEYCTSFQPRSGDDALRDGLLLDPVGETVDFLLPAAEDGHSDDLRDKARDMMGLDAQVATDEMASYGSVEGLINLLLKTQGMESNDAWTARQTMVPFTANEVERDFPGQLYKMKLPPIRNDSNVPSNDDITQALRSDPADTVLRFIINKPLPLYAYQPEIL